MVDGIARRPSRQTQSQGQQEEQGDGKLEAVSKQVSFDSGRNDEDKSRQDAAMAGGEP
jgi:hypothetical protein